MKLIIAEKPQVATAITEAIDSNFKKRKGYIEADDFHITWCVGHLLEISFPDEEKKWHWEQLPLKSDGWFFKVNEKTKEQYETVTELLNKSDLIIHAGDPDDEGQLIVDSILYKNGIIDLSGNSNKTIKRLLINDFNTEVIAKQMRQLKDNGDYLKLSLSAIARKLADMVFGFNMTRAYTIKNYELGNTNVISIGRVQTPMLGLIVRRDYEVKNHVKSLYYDIAAQVDIDGQNKLIFKYEPKDEEIDDNKRIADKIVAEEIVKRIQKSIDSDLTYLTSYKKKEETDNVPLPYNLLDLQVDCSKFFKLKADEVMSITQSLREKHKAITYNRSDCNYLLDETYTEAPDIINILSMLQDDSLKHYLDNIDMNIKSKAFDTSKTSAHTAIIPTCSKVDLSALTDKEKKVYLLIAKRFLMQFFPSARYIRHIFEIKCNETDIFKHSHRELICAGWKAIVNEKEDEGDVLVNKIKYYVIKEGSKIAGSGISLQLTELETKPKKLYTMDTFLNDLKRVAVYCKDEKIKQLLKDKDKDKAGESGGIGTPATRSEIIKKLYERGYIVDEKNHVVSTKLAKDLLTGLSDTITYPDMTALWHEQLKDMDADTDAIDTFINSVTDFSINEINELKNKKLNFESNAVKCPQCGGYLVKRKGQYGYFWNCSNYPNCDIRFQDKNGKPDIWKAGECPLCNSALYKINGKNGAFWKCQNSSCSKSFPDKSGEPDFSEKPTASDKYKCLECNSKLVKR